MDSKSFDRIAIPRVVIASPQGNSGKTVISLGICAALQKRRLTVQPFKKGPDYIDPSWLSAAAGRDCRNLDLIMMSEEAVLNSFHEAVNGADIAVIEGAMGLYDGFNSSGSGSTACLSRLMQSTIILVINAERMTRSIAAIVSGYQHFEPGTKIAGVILNNVAGKRHEEKLRNAIGQYCGIPVVGSLPKDSHLNIPRRHLGLVPFAENNHKSVIDEIQQIVENNTSLDMVMKISNQAENIAVKEFPAQEIPSPSVKIGVFLDKVFHFYYPENLKALKQNGAELVFIDSLTERRLPDIDALYIGGGFPELFLDELEANAGLRQDIARAIEDCMPVYAECAGLMYLCHDIRWHNVTCDMVGTIPASVELCDKPQGHGYAEVEVVGKNPWFLLGTTFWGHEFHHSKLSGLPLYKCAYHVLHGRGIDGNIDGLMYKNMFASYIHLHALAVPSWAQNFSRLASNWKSQAVCLNNNKI